MTISIPKNFLKRLSLVLKKYHVFLVIILLGIISIFSFIFFYNNGLGLAYNDSRSHLDIGRRVVEGLKPGLAQLGSVWLPLPHVLMIPTIWNDFFWHTGLSGAIQSMISFIATGLLIMAFLRHLKVGFFGQIVGLIAFVFNFNIIYLQSTAMTELLLIATLLASSYELLRWYTTDKLVYLIRTAFWIMLTTLIRYEGWFLLFHATVLVLLYGWKKYGLKNIEGMFFFFTSFAGVGVVLWLLWNLMIFGDPLYFALGPYSAHSQQEQIESAGLLLTKGNALFSTYTYSVATVYNVGIFPMLLAIIGGIYFVFDKSIGLRAKLASTTLLAPFIFNVLALFLGHSVLFIPEIMGDSWFNIRYGIMMLPAVAIGIGYLVHRLKSLRFVILFLLLFVTFFSFTSWDAVTIDDAKAGSSQKNVSEVSGWLAENASDEKGFILISAASHDAIIFTSGLPMKKFIHEGTGKYWDNATTMPDRWARWIIMRTNDETDLTFKLTNESEQLFKYDLIHTFPFADIYQLKPEYLDKLQTEPVTEKNWNKVK
jgi:hypothetical protein